MVVEEEDIKKFLDKYCITHDEYQTIAFEISEALKFGACYACV